ncbi:MAG: ABC transporter permease [Mesorhizobium sp.]|uniref:ABC transporter permease n=2 Tax=Mesorhizobium sp. TaxID=1871066 RepID=UPI000FE8D286|nr:ABC transporter permease [Mesorhizobium sp.]RWD49320.1 MAG: ABC transporter permease [Mesorhizobium sp.]RWE55868.1 MAG: ABC transporter permease [Mesorhizobium sp.]RWF10897.1 MAG: ABC transporter permease [Mesorhizobium sp.]
MSALEPTKLDRPRASRDWSAADSGTAKSVAAALRRADLGDRLRSLALAAPLLVLLALSFGIPIVLLLSRAVYDPTIADALPQTSQALRGWNGTGLPDDAAFLALAADLRSNQAKGTAYELAKSLNARLPGARSQVLKTVRQLEAADRPPLEVMKAVPFWSAPGTWPVIESGTHSVTSFYLLSALDLRWNGDGGIERVSPEQAIFVQVFMRTFFVAAAVTLATLILGFPLAYLIASVPKGVAAILIVAVLLPFWTSILVRTAAWTVLLQKFGLVNDLLLWLGVADDRLDLMYSRIGLIIAMTHIQLPFTLLPIYSVMRTIQPSQMKAAYSLGAKPYTAFRRVYLPQVFPGVMAGCLLTFILCLGYYITPALIGGASDQLISNFIASYVNVELNWEMAAALSFILLVFTLALFGIFARMLGLDRLKLV